MSATIAYPSAPFVSPGLLQFRGAFTSSAASINARVTSSSSISLPFADSKAFGELFYGDIKAIGGDEFPDFGYMISPRVEELHGFFDARTSEPRFVSVHSSETGHLSSLAHVNGLDGIFEMSSSVRKDLFIAVTLPLLGMGLAIFAAVGGSYAYTLSASTRLDDSLKALTALVAEQSKSQAVANQQISTISKTSDDSSVKLDKVVNQLSQMNATLLVMKSQNDEKQKAN